MYNIAYNMNQAIDMNNTDNTNMFTQIMLREKINQKSSATFMIDSNLHRITSIIPNNLTAFTRHHKSLQYDLDTYERYNNSFVTELSIYRFNKYGLYFYYNREKVIKDVVKGNLKLYCETTCKNYLLNILLSFTIDKKLTKKFLDEAIQENTIDGGNIRNDQEIVMLKLVFYELKKLKIYPPIKIRDHTDRTNEELRDIFMTSFVEGYLCMIKDEIFTAGNDTRDIFFKYKRLCTNALFCVLKIQFIELINQTDPIILAFLDLEVNYELPSEDEDISSEQFNELIHLMNIIKEHNSCKPYGIEFNKAKNHFASLIVNN